MPAIRHVRKAPSSALSTSSWEDVPDPDGMNRWVGILGSLVTRSSRLAVVIQPRITSACRAGRDQQPPGGLWILMRLIKA